MREALSVANSIANERQTADALSDPAPLLPKSLLPMALSTASSLKDEPDRAIALAGVAQVLPELLLREAFSAAESIEEDLWQSHVWAGLLARLADLGFPEEAYAKARQIHWEKDRATTLLRIAPYLEGPVRDRLYNDVLEALNDGVSSINSVEDLVEAVGRLIELGCDAKVLLLKARQIRFDQWRQQAIRTLIPRLLELPAETLRSLLQLTLRVASRRARDGVLSDLEALAPIIHALGGIDAVASAVNSIREVTKWWQ